MKESIGKMSKAQQLEVTHKALSDQSNELLKEEEPKSSPDEELDELSEKPVNLKSKNEINRANWP